LPLEHGRANHEDSADTSPQEQFFQHQATLDGLAKPNAIAKE
jgi:hypothetical protein